MASPLKSIRLDSKDHSPQKIVNLVKPRLSRRDLSTVFTTTEIIESIPSITHLRYIDTSEITGAKTFDTLTRLSSVLGFPPPDPKDRHYFEGALYGELRPFVPLRFLVPYKTQNLEFTCSLAQLDKKEGVQDITSLVAPKGYENDANFSHLRIYAKEPTTILVNEALELARVNLEQLFNALDLELKRPRGLKATEERILDYLKSKPKLAMDLKGILDRELRLVRQERPELVQSWKHYLEFERLCGDIG